MKPIMPMEHIMCSQTENLKKPNKIQKSPIKPGGLGFFKKKPGFFKPGELLMQIICSYYIVLSADICRLFFHKTSQY